MMIPARHLTNEAAFRLFLRWLPRVMVVYANDMVEAEATAGESAQDIVSALNRGFTELVYGLREGRYTEDDVQRIFTQSAQEMREP